LEDIKKNKQKKNYRQLEENYEHYISREKIKWIRIGWRILKNRLSRWTIDKSKRI